MLRPLIVGFGRAGRDLHLRCLRKTRAEHPHLISADVGVVTEEDPYLSDLCAGGIRPFGSLADARQIFSEDSVVHICTPPATHFHVLQEAAELGYRRIIVEKPLACTMEEVSLIRALRARYKLQIFVVATWLSSSLTARLKAMLAAPPAGAWTKMSIQQLKPRFSHTLNNRSHTSALEVEIPHQVALSLYLAGTNVEVTAASCSDMRVNGTTVPLMGSASIVLQHVNGQSSWLHSDLTAPVRERSVEIVFADGRRVVGYYPSEAKDSFSQLHVYNGENALVSRDVFFDDPLSTFLAETYAYFECGAGDPPPSNLDFHEAVMSVLWEAKRRTGLASGEPATSTAERDHVLS
jgi:predicted dehydrogenase